MAWVNAFIRAWNENRQVNIGGRAGNDSVGAWLNVQTSQGCFDMTVRAECYGPGLRSKDRRTVSVGDGRKASFEIELPQPSEMVEVNIRTHGARMADLVRLGAMLCGVQAVQDIAQANVEKGRTCSGTPARSSKTWRTRSPTSRP
jgi:hypothetical protein